VLDQERRTWTRSVGTKNRSSRRTVLQSHQRVLAHKRTAIFRSGILNHFGMTTGYSLYPHSILSAFSLVTIHENDGILDEERRTWTRSVGTKNRSSRRTGTRSGTKNSHSFPILNPPRTFMALMLLEDRH